MSPKDENTRVIGSGLSRRQMVATGGALATSLLLPYGAAARSHDALPARLISTTQDAQWVDRSDQLAFTPGRFGQLMVRAETSYQTIEGFGACFNELGWDALNLLSEADRNAVFDDFFSPPGNERHSMGFTNCRMPVAANDFARDWYSYNETPGDFAMENFSIGRDRTSLIPYIQAAQQRQRDLFLWGSPWSPPTWMKTNNHYAQRPLADRNDLTEEGWVREGENGFIQDDRYFRAYALYFRKYVEAYRAEGIPIRMVMPQNEFNSDQAFPSCVWTPEVLARFVGFLDQEMREIDVDIFLGTIERPDPYLIHHVMRNRRARRAIKGMGFQWAGRHAAPYLHYDYPDLPIYQTEQECGDGKNDWRFARHSWRMIKDFMQAGTTAYQYWNMALVDGAPSSWKWSQNSLVTVDREARAYEFTPDYYTLKHVCHFVRPGARRVQALTWHGFENALAFQNPDGSEVLVVGNDMPGTVTIDASIKGQLTQLTLPPNSLNTLVV
jgi:glucosylceramidase